MSDLTRRIFDPDNTPYQRPANGVGHALPSDPASGQPAPAPPRPAQTPRPRGAPASTPSLPLANIPDVDLTCLPVPVLRAGEAFLQRWSAAVDTSGSEGDSDATESESNTSRNSYSQTVSRWRRARISQPAMWEVPDVWSEAPVREASGGRLRRLASAMSEDVGAVADGSCAPVTSRAAADAMLARERAVDRLHTGGEMVESEMRRVVAEQSYVALQCCCGHLVGSNAKALLGRLRAYIATCDDKALRAAARKVLEHRVDPRTALGLLGRQEKYSPVTAELPEVGLRDLAALVWAAIENAPGDATRRDELRALLLYNLADCARENDFACPNGTFQRLLAPLHRVYPGVQTLLRTPYEVVEQVALKWRAAIMRGERGDKDADWAAFTQTCLQSADAWFERGTPMDALIGRQLDRAIKTCREELRSQCAD